MSELLARCEYFLQIVDFPQADSVTKLRKQSRLQLKAQFSVYGPFKRLFVYKIIEQLTGRQTSKILSYSLTLKLFPMICFIYYFIVLNEA